MARLTGDTARAQELTQETFIRTYRALVRGERWHNPRAWLYRVASRLATDNYRRYKLFQWLPLSRGESGGSQGIEATVTECVAVQATLNSLPPKYRIPLTLYVHEGCTVAEIAETLEISVSAVKMRLSRAREKFRQTYEQDGCHELKLIPKDEVKQVRPELVQPEFRASSEQAKICTPTLKERADEPV